MYPICLYGQTQSTVVCFVGHLSEVQAGLLHLSEVQADLLHLSEVQADLLHLSAMAAHVTAEKHTKYSSRIFCF